VALLMLLGVGLGIGWRLQAAADYTGVWAGTWDGSGSGDFVLTLEKHADGELGGRVAVTGEPTYKATLKKVTFDGSQMSALYDFPPDDRAEVMLSATFTGERAKGTWVLRAKDGSSTVASGGWTVVRRK
jgi:hypothetical protein